MGWKMVYNFLGKDEKKIEKSTIFDQNVRTVYSNILTVYPSKNHVTTHPEVCGSWCVLGANINKGVFTTEICCLDYPGYYLF